MKSSQPFKKFIHSNLLLGLALSSISTASFSQTCSELSSSLNSIQSKQYNFKESDAANAKRLIELEKEHDATLSQLAIIHELHKINDKFFDELDPNAQSISEEGFDRILATIKNVASDNLKDSENKDIKHLTALENMAAMDSLLNEMKSLDGMDKNLFRISSVMTNDGKASLDEAATDKVTAIYNQCKTNRASALCKVLAPEGSSSPNENVSNLISGFIKAYSADQDSNANEKIRLAQLNNYHNILRTGINPDANLVALFESAKSATSATVPAATIAKVRSYASEDNQNIKNLELAYCCTIPRAKTNNRESCKEAEKDKEDEENKGKFNRSKCEEYTKQLPASLGDVLSTFVGYEKNVYDTLNFDFDRVTENALMDKESSKAYDDIINQDNALSNYVRSVTGGLNFLGTGGAQTRVTENFGDLTKRTNTTEEGANKIKARLACLFRKGKINVADGRDISLTGIFTIAGIEEHDNPRIVSQINKRICEVSNKVKSQSIDCERNEVIYISHNADTGDYEVKDFEKLLEVFGDSKELHKNWEEMQKDYQDKVNASKAKIDQLKSKTEYAHLEQLKNFMISDYKSRCSVKAVDIIGIAACNSDISEDGAIDYLLGSVNQVNKVLLAEYNPENVRKNDLANATIQQRRIILGNMDGACQGLNRLNGEKPDQGFSSPAITSVCARVVSMKTEANKTTAYERTQRIESRGYRLTGDGNYKKKKSTGSQIGLGVLQGLGNSAGTLVGTYFQGKQLNDSIPYQERYIYNQMDQQYAYNWYQQNAQPNYFYPGMNNAYYLPQFSGYSGGYNFNATGL